MAVSPRSLTSGRVFIKAQFDKRQMDAIYDGLNYISTAGAVRDVTQLKSYGSSVLSELKKNFPAPWRGEMSEANRPYRNLRKGWHVNYYAVPSKSNGTILGFYVDHEMSSNSRARTILASLEVGSSEHLVVPVNGSKYLRFKPKGKRKYIYTKYAMIPAQDGQFYMRKTALFAEQMLAAKSTGMAQDLANTLEQAMRGTRNTRDVSATDFQSMSPSMVDAFVAAGKTPRRNPLKPLANITQAKLRAKKFFGPNYR